MELLNRLYDSEEFKKLSAALSKGGATALFGVHPIHSAAFAAALAHEGRRVIFVTEIDALAFSAAEDMRAFGVEAVNLPSRDFVFLDVEGASHELELERLSALSRLASGKASVLCASVEALCQYTIPPEIFTQRSFALKKDSNVKISELSESLVAAGYARSQRVEGRGQFAVRGGIVDLFPAGEEHPLRLEFFGDDIERIALFDEDSQRRIRDIDSALVTPVREVALASDGALRLREFAKRCKGESETARLALRDADNIENGLLPPSADRYLFTAYESPATAIDYLPEACFFINEHAAVLRRHKSLLELHSEELAALKEQSKISKAQKAFYLEDYLSLERSRPRVLAEAFTRGEGEERLSEIINLNALVTPRWSGEMSLLTEDVGAGMATGYSTVVLAPSARAVKTIAGDLRAAGFEVLEEPKETPPAPSVSVAEGALTTGFQLASCKLNVIASAKEAAAKKRRKRRRDEHSRQISRLEDLHEGDLVVHDMHGVGRFDGIHRIDHHGFVRDYIKISYRGADTLYVPVTQLDLVSQYIAPGDGEVKLAKLHSGEWAKTKAAVYRSVKEMAGELIELYAKREQEKGVAFSPDGDWQQNFETRFEYEETPDQLRTTAEIKADMEKSRPMDRVLCGDVGVGKTEVALRAAFKCVNEGYQCAVLVPTTILAWQHYRTICERMESFPIKIAMLSRFATSKEIKAAVEGIKKGTVDIAVGTHRLLQKDVDFKKLGLLIIDEEQRFGVAHKEKLKQKFVGVDVLTLSATPIPRTLNMALSGIRDMSVIDEPPEDRHPVQTYVVEYDEGIICDAIRREAARGGQVYYLHNRVESIDRCAGRLSELMPDLRIETAHGKMSEDELSEVWRRLLGGECDVLVCTTIIETGVDVPNCNTLIVENADRLGLSQLYQIRGRVGRSARRAFAYFTFRRDKTLSEVATKRLSAIKDFTSFGSGFKIAMRDLQIRGAGSVLSARQSGHMQAVGYDTYLKILAQAVEEASGAPPKPDKVECTVDLAISAYLPEEYVADNESRIELYKRIAAIQNEDDAEDVLLELRDRFGEPPEAATALVEVALIRALAEERFIYEVGAKGRETLIFYTDSLDKLDLSDYIKLKRRRVYLTPKGKSCITAAVRSGERLSAVALELLNAMTVVEEL